MMPLQYAIDLNTAATVSAILGVAGSGAAWISKKFERLQAAFEDKMDNHEVLDIRRFDSLTNDIWNLKILNASKFGEVNGSDPKAIERRTD